MKTYKSLWATLGSVLLCSSALPLNSNAGPLVSVGDQVDVFFNGSSSLRWTSNVFSDPSDESEDIVKSFTPGFDINVGRGLSDASLGITTRYEILRYDDLKGLDTELFRARANGVYQSTRLDLNGHIAFSENQSATENQAAVGDENQLNGLIENETVSGKLAGEYRTSPKFSFGAAVNYTDKVYTNEGKYYENNLADIETVSIPVDVFYELTPKADLSAGYKYETREVGGIAVRAEGDDLVLRESTGYETESHFFNIGARGQLMPKLTGFFKVGYSIRESGDSSVVARRRGENNVSIETRSETNRKDRGLLALDADFSWTVSPKLNVRTKMSRRFGVGSEGDATEISRIRTDVSYSINTDWSASANAGYTNRDYENDRVDDQYSLGASLSFRPNQYWFLSSGYNYIENDSNQDGRGFKNHIFTLSASLRY